MTVGELNIEIGAKLDKLDRQLGKMDQSIGKAGKQAERTANSSFKAVGAAIVAAFSVDAIVNFSKQVIAVRSEFEKFEAVLTNTLGSDSEARLALADIQDFAARTPFSVQELSGAFVKLTNYGLKPSMEAMRQYGDLASAVGKGFDQLAEAVADATTGEFERLKEFGIKAKKEGDKVTFTFKEQATEVAFTTEAIEAYIKSLGDLEGVSGSMAAISETLGGKVSNLGDNYDRLLNEIGKSSAWNSIIEGTSGLLEVTTEFVTYLNQESVPAVSKWSAFLSLVTGNIGGSISEIVAANAVIESNNRQILEGRAAMEAYAKEIKSAGEQTESFRRAQEALLSLPTKGMPSVLPQEGERSLLQLPDENLENQIEQMRIYTNQLNMASASGQLFGNTLTSAFEASLVNGESFFDVFADGLRNMIQQLIAAAAASAVLATILSAIMPGLGFGAAFGQVFSGGGSGGGLGGNFGQVFKLLGTDLVASTGRTGTQQSRSVL